MIKDFISSITKDGLMIACGVVILVLLAFITYAAVFIPLANPHMVDILFGNIMGLAGMVASYYFGSSKGSVDKTKIMADKQSNA